MRRRENLYFLLIIDLGHWAEMELWESEILVIALKTHNGSLLE